MTSKPKSKAKLDTKTTSKSKPQRPKADPPPHDPVWEQSAWRSRTRSRLLDWFASNHRVLPWRSDPQPYHVWVSEIMLQQTQVATVIPYYERFLKQFPTVAALAAADESSLLSHWEGLGYYRRARSMHAAAKQICEQHDAVFPTTFDDVLNLPGIGRYTAGAIMSISQGQSFPVLEGNTQRVFSRWVAMQGVLSEKPTLDLLWQIAEAMLPKKGGAGGDAATDRGPGIFNQAAMELGALICTPRSPKCDQCPVRASCCARKRGIQETIPGKVKKIDYEDRTEFAFVIANRDQSQFLVRPIPTGERWAGLWDFPRLTTGEIENESVAAAQLHDTLSTPISVGDPLMSMKHAVTKYRIRLNVFRANVANGSTRRWKPPAPWKFATLAEIDELPMSVTGRKIAKELSKCR
ncbi:A/G-specific adenine glycosylase [Novipirellula sp. SH528]|uniref:A/G-specific adenine glycosylase n=1 Tax=Novipirellula sp. SH528 TaxID=3454466 RepID=UPI003F9F5574